MPERRTVFRRHPQSTIEGKRRRLLMIMIIRDITRWNFTHSMIDRGLKVSLYLKTPFVARFTKGII